MDEILKLLSELKKKIEKIEKSFTVFVQGWTAVTFQNSWVNYDGTFNQCGYLRDPHGFVHLRGLVKSGTIGTTIFTLPAGYRPEYQQLFNVQSNSALGRCDVKTNGEVTANAGNNAWFSLDGLIFKAYQ